MSPQWRGASAVGQRVGQHRIIRIRRRRSRWCAPWWRPHSRPRRNAATRCACEAAAISWTFCMPSAVSMMSSKPIALLAALRGLDLGHQHVHRIDVRRGADLGDHDQVQPVARLLQHVHHVAVHVMRVEAVDPHRELLLAPVDVADRLDDVLARLLLVVRRHRVLEVEEDHVGGGLRRLLEQLGLASRHGQFAAVEAGGGLFDGLEAHGGARSFCNSRPKVLASGRNPCNWPKDGLSQPGLDSPCRMGQSGSVFLSSR